MKVSVIISACDKREHLFEKALDTWENQSLPKDQWEMLVVDDAQREKLRELCREGARRHSLNIRFIRIDKGKSAIPVKTFIPVLTNNVGFRQARGDAVVITGPETLQARDNLKIAAGMVDRMECAYGRVYRASVKATEYMGKGWSKLKDRGMQQLLQIPGAKEECVTMPPHPPAYWYFMTVAREHVLRISGVDERFLGGLCGEDDDFSNRMKLAGVTPVFEPRILGIHQDHSREDRNDGIHIDRSQGAGYHFWVHNITLLKENLASKDPVTNKGHDWGSANLITLDETYGG
jgi:glycosyltransferase involved in cell wall biosynthesis